MQYKTQRFTKKHNTEKAMAARPSKNATDPNKTPSSEEDRSTSPTDSLPLYQQRDNLFT